MYGPPMHAKSLTTPVLGRGFKNLEPRQTDRQKHRQKHYLTASIDGKTTAS